MSDLPHLSAEEQRVLGALLEKQRTVPASYPMTLNSLRTACNQSNSREPVVEYDETTVEQVGRGLKDRGLIRIVWSDTGRRTLKYHQVLDELLGLAEDERAVLTVMLLRGPQASGGLKPRTERLHAFEDRTDVEETLARMAERGLVKELPRQSGQRDTRWVHLLGDLPADAPSVSTAPAGEGREDVIADGAAQRDARVRAAYDAIAPAYAAKLGDELGDLPFERWLLDRVVELAGDLPVVEVGSGPGHVTAHLAGIGADASGLDLSATMVAQARAAYPEGQYDVGDLRTLMRPAGATGWGAVLAWYSLIHLAPSELPAAVAALARPIAPGGTLVLALHAGSGVLHADEWFDQQVGLDFVLHEPHEVVALLEAAGLSDVEWYRRGPVTARGEANERLYVLARTPH